MADSGPGLVRRLGLFPATLTGVGVILGAGIYVLVGVASNQAGNALWLAFLLAGVPAGLTGLSYARLGRLRPRDAPEFQYLDMAFGRTPAFLAGWFMLWATIISSSTVALGFAGYLEHVLPVPYLAGAIGLIAFSSVIVFLGVGESAVLAGALTVVEVLGLLVIIVIGVPHLGQVDLLEMPLGLPGVLGATALVFFAFLGFEGIANLSEEMKSPERDLPRAILLALGISTVLYMLVALTAVSVVGWKELGRSAAPLAAVASRALGAKADLLLTLIALSSTANTVLLMLFSASRAMWALSCAGALPVTFCVIGASRRTPWIAIILVGAFTGAFALVRDVEQVANFTNFATLLAFAGVNATALKLFRGHNSASRVKHILLDRLLPLLGVATPLLLSASLGSRAALLGAVLLASGLLVHALVRRSARTT